MIQADHLTKCYGKTVAVNGASFAVQPGRVTGFLGPNGAGKTTLINVLGGLLALDSGNARIYDSNLSNDLESIRRKLGIVSQFDVLWDELTAADHMYLFAHIKRIKYS